MNWPYVQYRTLECGLMFECYSGDQTISDPGGKQMKYPVMLCGGLMATAVLLSFPHASSALPAAPSALLPAAHSSDLIIVRGGGGRGGGGGGRGGGVGGLALGALIAVTAVPVAPAAGLCWYWADPSQTQGYWDYCQ